MFKEIKISLPVKAIEEINRIVKQNPIYEHREDLILHAITDLLEQYKVKELTKD